MTLRNVAMLLAAAYTVLLVVVSLIVGTTRPGTQAESEPDAPETSGDRASRSHLHY